MNGLGERVYLKVQEIPRVGSSASLIADETPISRFLESVDRYFSLDIPMKVDGIEKSVTASICDTSILLFSINNFDFPEISLSHYSKSIHAGYGRVAKCLAQASTLSMILPTREYGRLIYEFDMTGSYKAIQTACPVLFF